MQDERERYRETGWKVYFMFKGQWKNEIKLILNGKCILVYKDKIIIFPIWNSVHFKQCTQIFYNCRFEND